MIFMRLQILHVLQFQNMPRYNRVVADFGQGKQLGSGKSPGILSVYFESNPVWVFAHDMLTKKNYKKLNTNLNKYQMENWSGFLR